MIRHRASLQDRTLLRHRGEGHLRFELPPELCEPREAEILERRMGTLDGVYRVVLYRGSRKLSVRYREAVCGFRDVALHLHDLIPKVVRQARRAPAAPEEREAPATHGGVAGLKERIQTHPLVQRIRDRFHEARQTAQAVTTLARHKLGKPSATPMTTEKLVINFLNDLVSFYLIKLHWDRITGDWLRDPIKYRYQWLSAFYLVFLLVRYRKSGNK